MLSIKSRIEHDSAILAGVKFTVRTLNKVQRAKRDFPIAQHVCDYSLVWSEYFDLLPKGWTELQLQRTRVDALTRELASEDISEDARSEKIVLLEDASARLRVVEASVVDDPDKEKRRQLLDITATLIRDEHLKPAAIRAGLVSIDGIEIDGKPATADSLLSLAGADYDDFIDEVYKACEAAAGLSSDQQKNSQSPTTSTGPVVDDRNPSNAIPAAV